MFVSLFMCIPRSRGKQWPLTLRCYLHYWSIMTPCEKGRWLVVVFSSCLKLSLLVLFMSIFSPMSHSFFLILLSCNLFVLSFVDLAILFGPSALLIVSSLQRLSGQHIPKGIYKMIQSKNSVIIELKVILYAIIELVLTF